VKDPSCSQGEGPLWTWGSRSIEPSRWYYIELSPISRANLQAVTSTFSFDPAYDFEGARRPWSVDGFSLPFCFCHHLFDDPDLQLRTPSRAILLAFVESLATRREDSESQSFFFSRIGTKQRQSLAQVKQSHYAPSGWLRPKGHTDEHGTTGTSLNPTFNGHRAGERRSIVYTSQSHHINNFP